MLFLRVHCHTGFSSSNAKVKARASVDACWLDVLKARNLVNKCRYRRGTSVIKRFFVIAITSRAHNRASLPVSGTAEPVVGCPKPARKASARQKRLRKGERYTRARFEGGVLTAFAEQLAFAPDMRDGASDGLSVTADPVPLAPYPVSLARERE
jgi:hypothetical protein